MNRFNYHPTRVERVRMALPAVLLGHIRFPLALAGSAIFLVAAAWSFETQRLHALEGQVAATELRVHAAAAGAHVAERLSATVVRLRAMHDRITAARRDVLVATNTIAEIGNELPAQTWLTNVGASTAGTWTIGGRSTHVDEIGAMLRRVQGLDPAAPVRLVSIAATGRAGRVLDFVIGWDRHGRDPTALRRTSAAVACAILHRRQLCRPRSSAGIGGDRALRGARCGSCGTGTQHRDDATHSRPRSRAGCPGGAARARTRRTSDATRRSSVSSNA